jgi:type II secretory pathway component PulM
VAAGLSGVRQAIAGISPRERRLLLILGIVLAALAFAGFYYWSSSAIDEIETQRAATLDALRTIRNERAHINERRARQAALIATFNTPAPALTSFVEAAARDTNVTVVEATDRPAPTNNPQRFQRRSVVIRLRHVDLQSLVAFMNRIDQAPFPIAITSVRIRKRFGESNSYDVDDMVISTWDRNARAPIRPGRPGATSSGSSSGSTNRTSP